MLKVEKLFSAERGAFMTRLTLSSFRTKVSHLGIKGQKQGVKVFYTRKQLEDIQKGIPSRRVKSPKAKKMSKAKPTRKTSRQRGKA